MSDFAIERWVRPEIRAMSAYHVADPGDLLKMDMMENPYTWNGALREAWSERLRAIDVNRYPDPQARALKQRLGEAFAIPPEAGILLGNGSDELIQMILMTVARPGRVVLSVDPGFVMYRLIATFTGMDYVGVPLRADDFSLDTEALLDAIERHDPAVVFLAYPNNPTGNLFPAEAIRRVLDAASGLVVVDEAYAPFTDASFLPELMAHPRLLVMRTVSKMGLAGLRLGYLAGAPEWIAELDKTRLPFNINSLTQVSADFALEHKAELDRQTEAIRAQRDELFTRLQALDGLRLYPSEANFILARTAPGRADAVHHGLREHGILIKNLHGAHPMLADCLRITVGTPDENQALLAALGELISDGVLADDR